MKIIGIGGEPATGKSTLMRAFMAQFLNPWTRFKNGLVIGHINWDCKVGVLGSYEPDQVFPGTDRMSMAAQPKVCMWLEEANRLSATSDGWTWIFEGDRLFTPSMLDFIRNHIKTDHAHVFLVLEASDEAKAQRHKERRDNQPETFLKAKATKIANIKAKFPETLVMRHESPGDTAEIVRWLRERVEEGRQEARP